MSMYDKLATLIANATTILDVTRAIDKTNGCKELNEKEFEQLYFLGNDKVQNLAR